MTLDIDFNQNEEINSSRKGNYIVKYMTIEIYLLLFFLFKRQLHKIITTKGTLGLRTYKECTNLYDNDSTKKEG